MKYLYTAFIVLLFSPYAVAQQRTKEVQDQNQFWFSINTNSKLSTKWSLITDVHIRRTNFLKDNSFYFLRIGAGYKVNERISLAAGTGHMWLANQSGATELFSNENRIYQQANFNSSLANVIVSNRLRIEERWQQKVVAFRPINDYRYTTRFRYQFGLTIPVSKNKKVPSLSLADEVMLQMGKDIIYNTFDQNRVFVGLLQQVTPTLSFDFGYMHVWQQKLTGYQYSRNHTIRWFFYWRPDLRKKKHNTALAFEGFDAY